MKNTFFCIVMSGLVLFPVLLFTGCPTEVEENGGLPPTKGELTLNGVPETVKGKYVTLFENLSVDNVLLGLQDGSGKKFTGVKIENDVLKIPLYEHVTSDQTTKAYEGTTHISQLRIYISDQPELEQEQWRASEKRITFFKGIDLKDGKGTLHVVDDDGYYPDL